MNETFRNMRSWGGLALGCAAVIPVGCGGSLVYMVLADPKLPHAVWSAVFFGALYLLMGVVWIWLLLDYWRGYLRIAGDRIISRGAVETREILFAEVTELRWHSSGRVVVIVAGPVRIRIDYNDNLTRAERERIVRYLRSSVREEVQTGWMMFAYRFGMRKPGAGPRKPGPDEVMMTRARRARFLNQVFAPTVVVAAVVGVAEWWMRGELRRLAAPVMPLFLWGLMWAVNRWDPDSTDVSVEKDMSVVFWTERGRFWRFALVWLFVGLMGTVVFGALRERFLYPATVACVGAFAWAGVFVYESWLEGRVQARVDLEEAELAAKERGEMSPEMGR